MWGCGFPLGVYSRNGAGVRAVVAKERTVVRCRKGAGGKRVGVVGLLPCIHVAKGKGPSGLGMRRRRCLLAVLVLLAVHRVRRARGPLPCPCRSCPARWPTRRPTTRRCWRHG